MDDPGLSWPYWKFGLKRDDLSGKLHDQYNTFPSSIQDPEAFHHDVFEISNQANTTVEFYRLLGDRKQQRLRELNESLESAAVEIIANPSLIGTEQWQYALQLFRTKSLDSLVRFFASYLPDDHPWHKPYCDSSSASETGSTVDSIANSHSSFFGDQEDGPIMTDEPLSMSASLTCPLKSQLPLSPRSMTVSSDSSAASLIDDGQHKYVVDNLTPARTLSFSEPESETFEFHDSQSHHDQNNLHTFDLDTPSTSISELSEPAPFEILEMIAAKASLEEEEEDHSQEEEVFVPEEVDLLESETPTPRPEQPATSFFDSKSSLPHRRYRSTSPSRPHPLSQSHSPHLHYHDVVKVVHLPRLRRREYSPGRGRWRSPGGPAARIHKPLPDPVRSRPRVCRRFDS